LGKFQRFKTFKKIQSSNRKRTAILLVATYQTLEWVSSAFFVHVDFSCKHTGKSVNNRCKLAFCLVREKLL
jgi:hypothetical protein